MALSATIRHNWSSQVTKVHQPSSQWTGEIQSDSDVSFSLPLLGREKELPALFFELLATGLCKEWI
jgi:hypothetical protein